VKTQRLKLLFEESERKNTATIEKQNSSLQKLIKVESKLTPHYTTLQTCEDQFQQNRAKRKTDQLIKLPFLSEF
jgi:hypothetical protein